MSRPWSPPDNATATPRVGLPVSRRAGSRLDPTEKAAFGSKCQNAAFLRIRCLKGEQSPGPLAILPTLELAESGEPQPTENN